MGRWIFKTLPDNDDDDNLALLENLEKKLASNTKGEGGAAEKEEEARSGVSSSASAPAPEPKLDVSELLRQQTQKNTAHNLFTDTRTLLEQDSENCDVTDMAEKYVILHNLKLSDPTERDRLLVRLGFKLAIKIFSNASI